jgi:SAM-dependent methyltransferase
MVDKSLNYGRHLIRRFLQQAEPFTSVLDLGAGGGADLGLVQEIDSQARRLAIEVYPPLVNALKSNNVEVFDVNIENETLPFEDASVDVIIANQILEHTKEIFWIFHEVTRILPVGGKFIIGVPNLASFHNRLLLGCGRQPTSLNNASAHVRGYTRHDLMRFIELCFPQGYVLRGFG